MYQSVEKYIHICGTDETFRGCVIQNFLQQPPQSFFSWLAWSVGAKSQDSSWLQTNWQWRWQILFQICRAAAGKTQLVATSIPPWKKTESHYYHYITLHCTLKSIGNGNNAKAGPTKFLHDQNWITTLGQSCNYHNCNLVIITIVIWCSW